VGYNPNYKWINPTYPIYIWGYSPHTKWDEPPSIYAMYLLPFSAPNQEFSVLSYYLNHIPAIFVSFPNMHPSILIFSGGNANSSPFDDDKVGWEHIQIHHLPKLLFETKCVMPR
jgi:hypothetical protein